MLPGAVITACLMLAPHTSAVNGSNPFIQNDVAVLDRLADHDDRKGFLSRLSLL